MEEKKPGKFLARPKKKGVSKFYAYPFFFVLFALTVVAFIIPLRPTKSVEEKRELAAFPEFSWEALTSGDYFDDISLWFSDTFPGRDGWIRFSTTLQENHGLNDVVIYGELGQQETIPDSYVAPENTETRPPQLDETQPQGTLPDTTQPLDTAPQGDVEDWGGVNAGEGAEIYLGNVIQIGDTAFNYFRYSKNESDRFINTMTWYAEAMASREDLTVALTLIPTSVGVLVEPEYQEKIGCADQGEVIDYIFSGVPDEIVKINIFDTLVEHNDEYIYFRTDHHWTALGAYYGYVKICQDLGLEPAALEDFDLFDQGEFQGSNYYQANQSSALELDTVTAYKPRQDIKMIINNENGRFTQPMLTDMTVRNVLNSKYMTFLAGDHPLCEITNNDMPEDAGNCVIIKDSYGNAMAPFFTQNFRNTYVVDFREYWQMNMRGFVDAYDIDTVIFLIPAAAAQDHAYNNLIRKVCGF